MCYSDAFYTLLNSLDVGPRGTFDTVGCETGLFDKQSCGQVVHLFPSLFPFGQTLVIPPPLVQNTAAQVTHVDSLGSFSELDLSKCLENPTQTCVLMAQAWTLFSSDTRAQVVLRPTPSLFVARGSGRG